jgi:hypothetical protein
MMTLKPQMVLGSFALISLLLSGAYSVWVLAKPFI